MPLHPFLRLPHDRKRHAANVERVARDEATTHCGEDLIIPATRPTAMERRARPVGQPGHVPVAW